MDILLDESIPVQIEKALEKNGFKTYRFEKEAPDEKVLREAIKKDIPLVTRDQGDFVRLSSELDHPGIILDKQMHLRKDFDLVANTIKEMLEEIGEENLRGEVCYLSGYYGR